MDYLIILHAMGIEAYLQTIENGLNVRCGQTHQIIEKNHTIIEKNHQIIEKNRQIIEKYTQILSKIIKITNFIK